MSKEQAAKRSEKKQAAIPSKFWNKTPVRIVFIVLLILLAMAAVFLLLHSFNQHDQTPTATSTPTVSNNDNPGQSGDYISISQLTVFEITDTSISASWITNLPATGVLQATQPTTGESLSSWVDKTLVLEHKATISGLLPSTAYKLTVVSTDARGREVKVAIDNPYTTLVSGATIEIIVGDNIPDFSLTSTTGEIVSSAGFSGKRTLLVIWKISCDSCREELPHVNEFYKSLAGSDLEIITISVLEKAELVKSYVESKGYAFPVLLDPGGAVVEKFTVDKYPTNVLVDTSGKIAKIQEGPFKGAAEISAFVE